MRKYFFVVFFIFLAVINPLPSSAKTNSCPDIIQPIVEELNLHSEYQYLFFDKDKLNVYLFWWEGCPHCAAEKVFLDQLEKSDPAINIFEFELSGDRNNALIFKTLNQKINSNNSGVPQTFIGDNLVIGFSEGSTEKQITELINLCTAAEQAPPLPSPENSEFLKNIPFIGQIDIRNYSLPLLTMIIAALDGFNPCAMWILLFLISLLLGMQNKKRMWALGTTFIIASGLVYFLFLAAWLNFFLFIGFIVWIRIIIALIAIGSGIYHLREFYLNRPGCKVIKGERREKIFTNLKFITKIDAFWLALIGIIIIAFGVNLVELVCSAGLPAIYTNVLALSHLPAWQYYLLLLLYIVIFMIDDLAVFIIAMVTLQATGLTHKYTRYANLIGGIIILIIGILLILKPQWLMFT